MEKTNQHPSVNGNNYWSSPPGSANLLQSGAHSIQNDDEVILSSGTEENSSSSASGLVLFISSIAISDLFLILANYQRQ